MACTLAEAVTAMVAALEVAADPSRAEQERRYLKSQLSHLGVKVPLIRRVSQEFRNRHPEWKADEIWQLAEVLWGVPVHERRMCAAELLRLAAGEFTAARLRPLERLLRESRTWALLDNLAVHVVGPVVERDPAAGPVIDRWSYDPDFWLRRAALLALLLPLRRGEGDFDRFGRYADGMLEEREFFIRKAIGWVLRETSKRNPETVFRWLLPRVGRASGLTLREASKYLSADQRERLCAERSGQPNMR